MLKNIIKLSFYCNYIYITLVLQDSWLLLAHAIISSVSRIAVEIFGKKISHFHLILYKFHRNFTDQEKSVREVVR